MKEREEKNFTKEAAKLHNDIVKAMDKHTKGKTKQWVLASTLSCLAGILIEMLPRKKDRRATLKVLEAVVLEESSP